MLMVLLASTKMVLEIWSLTNSSQQVITSGTMQVPTVRLLQALKLSMVNTSSSKKMVVRLRVILLRTQMVLTASMTLLLVNA